MNSWSENPPARTRRMVSNVEILAHDAEHMEIYSNFLLYYSRHANDNFIYSGQRRNILRPGEDAYRISIAVAGFTDADLTIEARDGQLIISGKKVAEEKEVNYLHRGIATRAFEKRFQLADHVRALGATTENGLLHVDLVREVPEALKPRQIAISKGAPVSVGVEEPKSVN